MLQLAMAPDGSLYCLTQEEDSIASTLTKLSKAGQSLAIVNLPSATQALAVGADGSVYIGGQTGLPGVTPTAGAWQTSRGGMDGFVAKMNPSFSGFTWATYIGASGSTADQLNLIQPAPDGSLWISGATSDSSFPVLPGALQTQLSPGTYQGGFLVHLSADGSKRWPLPISPRP